MDVGTPVPVEPSGVHFAFPSLFDTSSAPFRSASQYSRLRLVYSQFRAREETHLRIRPVTIIPKIATHIPTAPTPILLIIRAAKRASGFIICPGNPLPAAVRGVVAVVREGVVEGTRDCPLEQEVHRRLIVVAHPRPFMDDSLVGI
jgi:hypothetical protein